MIGGSAAICRRAPSTRGGTAVIGVGSCAPLDAGSSLLGTDSMDAWTHVQSPVSGMRKRPSVSDTSTVPQCPVPHAPRSPRPSWPPPPSRPAAVCPPRTASPSGVSTRPRAIAAPVIASS
ncbi:MAG: hypothetical protein AVDCRST_MAG85-1105 [uncultured Solirubrobacteraceae bacterium]|uniref:Uncharacterized protein n=1 Tax=uncultured Solirubrobacteraceae bacterium TaxID=1162706 RepID=A0A6J4S4M4_9ACTN|nr:MAG: hypothetical protein AVDCRST_MAG85-1105 [uncultured Solirubrobacteraceae bacterium]